jgi:hypothetical protein
LPYNLEPYSDPGPSGRLSLTKASVEWGRGRLLCAPAKWKHRVGVVQLSCLSVASCVSSTTERFLLGDCPITTGNRSSLSFFALSASLHQPGCQILQSRRRRNLIAFSKSRHSWDRFLKTIQSFTQIKSSADRKNDLLNTGRFIMNSGITKIYYRKTVGHVFTKPVQTEGTTQIPPPSKLFFIVVHTHHCSSKEYRCTHVDACVART